MYNAISDYKEEAILSRKEFDICNFMVSGITTHNVTPLCSEMHQTTPAVTAKLPVQSVRKSVKWMCVDKLSQPLQFRLQSGGENRISNVMN